MTFSDPVQCPLRTSRARNGLCLHNLTGLSNARLPLRLEASGLLHIAHDLLDLVLIRLDQDNGT